jgi:bacterioferritin-associated ferredoxin
MYVCICNAVSDRDIRAAAQQGHRTVAQAYRALGVKLNCGQCRDHAKDIIDDVRRGGAVPAQAAE